VSDELEPLRRSRPDRPDRPLPDDPAYPASAPRGVPQSAEMFEESYTSSTPPAWDIGRPQPAFADLARSGGLVGRVLDVGCGTGEHVLLAASLGHEAVGVDFASRAIEAAREKAAARGLKATFLVLDVLRLHELPTQFDTVLDCGLFHGLDDDERRLFVDGLATIVRPGGRYHMLSFSDRQPGNWGPRRLTAGEIRASFTDGWTVDSIAPTVLDLTIDPAGAQGWQVTVTRQ
jgi:SAM-dependent methyltransferase